MDWVSIVEAMAATITYKLLTMAMTNVEIMTLMTSQPRGNAALAVAEIHATMVKESMVEATVATGTPRTKDPVETLTLMSSLLRNNAAPVQVATISATT